jgi:hypothetical protein
MAVGFPTKVSYVNGDVFSASDINDTNGTINLLQTSTLSRAAGKNAVIGGGMDNWQRGLSIVGSATAYAADRWQAYRGTTGSTFSRQNVNDTTNLPTIQYCTRVSRDSGNTSTSNIQYGTSFETVNSIPFAGQTVTLSFYARRGANYSNASNGLVVYLNYGTGTDQNVISGYTGGVSVIAQTATLTTTWQRFTYTGTVAATATELGVNFAFTPVGTAGAADYYEITGVQLEAGSYATTFSRAGSTIAGELALCQRYYEKLGTVRFDVTSAGDFFNSLPYKVTKRVAPTIAYTYAGSNNTSNNAVFIDTEGYTLTIICTAASDNTFTVITMSSEL